MGKRAGKPKRGMASIYGGCRRTVSRKHYACCAGCDASASGADERNRLGIIFQSCFRCLRNDAQRCAGCCRVDFDKREQCGGCHCGYRGGDRHDPARNYRRWASCGALCAQRRRTGNRRGDFCDRRANHARYLGNCGGNSGNYRALEHK